MELEVTSNRVCYTDQDELASQCKIILKPLVVVAEQEQILSFLLKEMLVLLWASRQEKKCLASPNPVSFPYLQH